MATQRRQREPLRCLRDPITYEPVCEPVVASDGHTYERSSIEAWIRRCKEQGRQVTSPLTREPIAEALRDGVVAARQLEHEQKQSEDGARAWFEMPGSMASLAALAQMFEVVDPLRDVLGPLLWRPPQIVVMGNENSGKSTLLERICMMPLFPTDKCICTRMAIKVCLRRGEPRAPLLEVREVATNEVVRSQHIATDAAATRIDEWMREEVQRENGGAVSGLCRRRMLVVHVQSSTAPNLDLVDLPGLVATHVHGEPEDMKEQTRQLVEDYLDRFTQHSLFLVTVPATAGPNQSIAMDIVQRRKLQEFTIGVLTKADLALFHDADDDDDDAADDAKSRVEELRSKLYQQSADVVPLQPHGYVVTMNKQPKRRAECRYDDLIAQAEREQRWFDVKGFEGNDRASVAALVAKLMHMYHAYAVTTWLPGAIDAVATEIDRLECQEHRLGVPRAHDLASIDPARLSASVRTRFEQLLDESALVTLCTRIHCEVLKDGQVFQTAVATTRLTWKLTPWLRSLSDQRTAEVEHSVNQCIVLSREYISTLLASDDSDLRFGRFERVIERIDAHVAELLENWRNEVQATLIGIIQDCHRVDCSPHITFTHSLDATAAKATVTCEIDYSKLNAAVCQLVMEGVCQTLENLQWEVAVADADDPGTWLESYADQRTALLRKLEQATTARRRLTELAAQSRQNNLDRLAVAMADGDMREVAASARWLVQHLRRLSSLDACELLGDQGAVELVLVALLTAGAIGTDGGTEALPPLLQCIRWLCNYGHDSPRDTKVLLNLERARQLGAAGPVVVSVTHDNAAVVAAALECLLSMLREPDITKAALGFGVVELAIHGVGTHLADARVAAAGCRLIRALSADNAVAERLSKAGACELVAQALHVHVANDEIAHWACAAIQMLSCQVDDNRKRFGEANACELVTRALEQHMPRAATVRVAYAVVQNMCSDIDSNRKQFGAAGACGVVTRALQQHLSNADNCKDACAAITNLCNTANRIALGSAGACELVTRALREHVAVAATAEMACRAIVSLCNDKNCGNALRFRAAGAKDAATRAVKRYAGVGGDALQWALNAAKCL